MTALRWTYRKVRRLYNGSSKYKPHQGKRECARRLRQLDIPEVGPEWFEKARLVLPEKATA